MIRVHYLALVKHQQMVIYSILSIFSTSVSEYYLGYFTHTVFGSPWLAGMKFSYWTTMDFSGILCASFQ